MIALRSKITRKLLNYYFINPEERLYVNELARKLDVEKRNLVKKLRELEMEGILKSQSEGNLKLYTINSEYPLYEEYRKIILKTSGFEETLKNKLKKVEGIKEAYIFGSYARDAMETYSDIDLLVIGDHSIAQLQHELHKLQKEINREINVINMDEKEYNKRIKRGDPFISNVIKGKRLRII